MSKSRYDTPLAQRIALAYSEGEDDEALEPIVLVDRNNKAIGRIKINDALIFANIRGEREIELTQAFVDPIFNHFSTKQLNMQVTTMIEYHPKLAVDIAFPPTGKLKNGLIEVLSNQKYRILKCVESEKGIHLTFFFNGKQHVQFPNEERMIIPSHETEDLAFFPEMKSEDVANATILAMKDGKFNLIVTNISPCDVMGHIENKEVVGKAIQSVDEQLGRIVANAATTGYSVLVTADHGVAESWLYPDGSIDTGHTSNPVPLLIISEKGKDVQLRKNGTLINIAPTILDIFGLDKPSEMEGESLIELDSRISNKKVLLLILDGWGYNEEPYGNLFMEFGTPNMDNLRSKYPFTTLTASGPRLGMPEGTVGNSEIGHLHMGVGRRVVSDRVKIFEAIETGSFYDNQAFLNALNHVKRNNSSLHILGIISFYSSHGSIRFLEALMELAQRQNISETYVHGLLGRRGEKPEAGAYYINKIEKKCQNMQNIKLVSVIGRHWALDREENWDRIEKTYDMLIHGKGRGVSDTQDL